MELKKIEPNNVCVIINSDQIYRTYKKDAQMILRYLTDIPTVILLIVAIAIARLICMLFV